MSELKIVESSGKQKSRVVASLKSPLTFVGQEANLQPSELFAIQPPRRFSTKTAFKTTIFQGPVLVGFKLTDKLDKNALEFIRFYSTNKS